MEDSARLPSGQKRIDRLELRGIVKRFPGVVANDGVTFAVHRGEIHTLLGENGAGKSTLMKLLYGLYQPDEGEILLDGVPTAITSPADAIRRGIGMVHQHFMLVPTLTVAENIALGLGSTRSFRTDVRAVADRSRELGERYGLRVEVEAPVWQLSVGERQRVEILKALYRDVRLLVMDEPTAVLTPGEVDELFTLLRLMAADGRGLVFISHKLREVLDITDRVTVLRDGHVVGTVPTESASRESLAQMMVGRPITLQRQRPPANLGQVRLELQDVWAQSDRETPALRGVNLAVHAGEILGLAGVSGNGQRELAEVITGLRPATQGRTVLNGETINGRPPGDIVAKGLAYIPEERMRDGMIGNFNVAENLILREHHRPPYSRAGFLNFRSISRRAGELISSFNVKTPSEETLVKSLSGGNIQKLVLARELSREPGVLVAAQPTRGLDIGATEYVHKRLLAQRSEGTAMLLISEDLDEILALSDRIAVIFEGQIMGEMPRAGATPEKLGLLMAGVRGESAVPQAQVEDRAGEALP
jgi:general nucleoside transport system ATP-binding protein